MAKRNQNRTDAEIDAAAEQIEGVQGVEAPQEPVGLDQQEDRDLAELTELLAGVYPLSPMIAQGVLAKARRLQRCSPVVQLAVLLLNEDSFCVD
jgi:hypothetical protein